MAFDSIFRQPAENYDIQLFVGDFEQAQWKAVDGKFPGARVTLCLYHWGRNVQKAIDRCGLKFMHDQDRSFRKAIALAKKLPFLHPTDMIKGFKAVGAKLAELFDDEERVDYLDNLRSRSLVCLKSDNSWRCAQSSWDIFGRPMYETAQSIRNTAGVCISVLLRFFPLLAMRARDSTRSTMGTLLATIHVLLLQSQC